MLLIFAQINRNRYFTDFKFCVCLFLIICSSGSSVALENPDLSIYPRAECSMEYSQKVVLHAGDALFIPEGW
jgi:hypothetical protein